MYDIAVIVVALCVVSQSQLLCYMGVIIIVIVLYRVLWLWLLCYMGCHGHGCYAMWVLP
jgi:hypothetical protein